MPASRFDDVANIALRSDEQLLERVRALVEGAYRRQLWLMFLDERECQLPILMPHDVPGGPTRAHRVGFRSFIAGLADEVAPSSIVVVLERPGSDTLRRGDLEWFAVLDDACRASGVRLRGPILAHDRGFRWVAADDLLVAPK